MSDEILRQLYEGEIYPCEQMEISSEESRIQMKLHEQMVQDFKEKLTERQRQEFKKIQTARDDIENEYDTINFIKGFQLGMQLTLAGLEIPHIKPKNDFER